MLSSCRTPDACGFHPYTSKAEWPNYEKVAVQKKIVFLPDEQDRPTRFTELADRIDYCEAYGESVNDALGVD